MSGVPWLIVVFALLYRIPTRKDFDTLTKILWLIVVIGTPVIGLVLYLLAALSARQPRSPRASGNIPAIISRAFRGPTARAARSLLKTHAAS